MPLSPLGKPTVLPKSLITGHFEAKKRDGKMEGREGKGKEGKRRKGWEKPPK